jgi:glutamate 5-kinase
VKVGTQVLTKADNSLDEGYLVALVLQIVALRQRGLQVILVTSGAVAAGKKFVTTTGCSDVVQKQIHAAVGQVKLMSTYADLFEKFDYHCAQVLASKEDFRDAMHYENMQNCFEGLLLDNVLPIVNENDVVATAELMFTDNDELAGLVAKQVQASRLIILTSTDGILSGSGNTIPAITSRDYDEVLTYITTDTTSGGRGGMFSKFKTAQTLAQAGIATHIVNGRKEQVLLDVMSERATGTTVFPC